MVERILQNDIIETVFLYFLIEEIGIFAGEKRGIAILIPIFTAGFPLLGIIFQSGAKDGLPLHREVEARRSVTAPAVPDFGLLAEVNKAIQIIQSLQKIGLSELSPRRGTIRQLIVRIECPVLAQFLAKMFEKDLFLHENHTN